MKIKDRLKLNIFESGLTDGIKSGLVALCEKADTLEELDEVNATFETMSKAITEASEDEDSEEDGSDDKDTEEADSKEKADKDANKDIPDKEESNEEEKGDKDVREKIKSLKDKLKKQ